MKQRMVIVAVTIVAALVFALSFLVAGAIAGGHEGSDFKPKASPVGWTWDED